MSEDFIIDTMAKEVIAFFSKEILNPFFKKICNWIKEKEIIERSIVKIHVLSKWIRSRFL